MNYGDNMKPKNPPEEFWREREKKMREFYKEPRSAAEILARAAEFPVVEIDKTEPPEEDRTLRATTHHPLLGGGLEAWVRAALRRGETRFGVPWKWIGENDTMTWDDRRKNGTQESRLWAITAAYGLCAINESHGIRFEVKQR